MAIFKVIPSAFLAALTALLIGTAPGYAVPELDEAELTTLRALERLDNDQHRCLPRLTDPVEAHVFYSHNGDGHVAGSTKKYLTRYADVRVEKTDKPALLILSAYSPVIWRIDAAPGARIAGIHLSGYNQQMLAAVPPGVTVSRSVLARTDGRKRRDCSMSVADPRPLAEHQAQRDKLKRSMPPILGSRDARKRQVGELNAEIKALEQVRIKLALALTGERPILTIDKMIEDAKAELDAKLTLLKVATATAARHEQTLREIEAEIMTIEIQMRRGDGSYFATYETFSDSETVQTLSKELAKLDVEIVNYINKFKDERFIASTASAAAYADLKVEGAETLAALKLPDLPLIADGARWMKSPYSRDRGVAYLVEKGYLREIKAVKEYYCAKLAAAAKARGVPIDKCGLQWNIYTALGGFTMPEGLCGGFSITVLVPPGVPMPRGEGCHSEIIDLSKDF